MVESHRRLFVLLAAFFLLLIPLVHLLGLQDQARFLLSKQRPSVVSPPSNPQSQQQSAADAAASPDSRDRFGLGQYTPVQASSLTPYCRKHFSSAYLTAFSFARPGFEYCNADSDPSSDATTNTSIRCFHTQNGPEQFKTDSFCLIRGAHLNHGLRKFQVPCETRALTDDEKREGGIDFGTMRGYWYKTGPPAVLRDAVVVQKNNPTSERRDEAEPEQTETETETETDTEKTEAEKPDAVAEIETETEQTHTNLPNNRTYILLRREGEGNLWHCLQEFFSLFLTMDALNMAHDASGASLYPSIANTQIVILDSRSNGPYWDLWSAVSPLPPVRMSDLLAATKDTPIDAASLVIPLAGAASNFWNDKPQTRRCSHSQLLDTFVRRVLAHYNVPTDEALALSATDANADADTARAPPPVRVTIIDRREHRRLRNLPKLMGALQRKFGARVDVAAVDFAAISFAEQLALVRRTDVLVGVHGAGLSHGMFMRAGAGAVVEIMPDDMDVYVFRDPARMRGLQYFRTHARSVEEKNAQADDDWHHRDIAMETQRFVEIVGAAVQGQFSVGLRNFDVSEMAR